MSTLIGPLLGAKRGEASRGAEFCGAAQFMSSFAAVQGANVGLLVLRPRA